jgi:hypothetical protein
VSVKGKEGAMSNQEREQLEKLIKINTRRLNVLVQQADVFGISAPPHVLLEIEDLKERLSELQANLAALDAPAEARGQSVTPPSVNSLTPQQKQRLIELLLAAPSMADRSIRDSLLSQLPDRIQQAISRNANSRADVFNIVSTVLNYQGGLQSLIDALRFFETDSLSIRAIDQFAATLPSASQSKA